LINRKKALYVMRNTHQMKTHITHLWPSLFGCMCLLFASSSTLAATDKKVFGYVMHVQLTPAVCSLDPVAQKQRKCLEGYSLTISSLLPEVEKNTDCETETSARLSPLQAKVVARVMPDSNARAQLWRGVGGCVPMSASRYFRMVINFAERLKVPSELTSQNTIEIKQDNLRQQFIRLNPSLPLNGVRFSCQTSKFKPILTEVQVCYQSNGQYRQCSSQIVDECPSEFTFKGSY